MTNLTNDWGEILQAEFEKEYYLQLREKLKVEYGNYTVFPDMYDIFNALHFTSYRDAKVILIGQDPYHGPGQAHGLSFSVQPGVRQPPSLKNIFKELHADLGYDIPDHGSLLNWTKQGVLLLNTVLTVRKKEPNSHKGIGWEHFTNAVIQSLNEREQPLVFLLWGKHAQQKEALITNNHHFILKSPHPSPFSANKGFFGSKPFSKINQFLRENDMEEIDWKIPNLEEQ
ncbi:uracil-DNA glycosylase [Pseudalkalibacillus berkeleyi]|uniref:Uracil-DNA glycosylase n=1 Tax=Pseudalkalibacillus berkeleyi TaxID=1069813 RepID=A0ABS9H513_9BACL|nr:uracil-DNA glycosylase [Pseudalkalibacillus berkeleyi]MCF6139011.1 uracil-DNA glycosylase [Pseudalkalibacillus berkeleyi]